MDWKIKEFAEKERVDERTVRRWIEKGALTTRRTPGGGVRIVAPESPPDARLLVLTAGPRLPR